MEIELAEIRDFLAAHPPFSLLPTDVLNALPARLSQRYFRRGSELVRPGDVNDTLYMLRSGAVAVFDEHGTLVEKGAAGSSFGGASLLRGGPARYRVAAFEDALVLCVPAEVFHELASHEAFAHFYSEQSAGRLRAAAAAVSGGLAAALHTRVEELVTRPAVTCAPTLSIREAAALMTAEDVSALLIVDAGLVGIVTDRDLRRRVVAAGADPRAAVATVMTADPVTVSAGQRAFDALLCMTRRGLHHLPVTRGAALVGMVTSGDVLRLEQGSPVRVASDIAAAPSVSTVAELTKKFAAESVQLLARGASSMDVAHLLTTVTDAALRRIVALAETELGPAPVPWSLVVLGSHARGELTPASDQDHALVLDDGFDAGRHGEWFARFSCSIRDGLTTCGIPPCPGDVMATTWCHSLSWWRRQLRAWLDAPTPAAVLEAQTFFDLRAAAGEPALARALRRLMTAQAQRSPRFLAHVAKRAQDVAPPLGFFREFVVARSGEHADTLDIKTGGLQPIVKLARLVALAHGLPEVGTRERLHAAVRDDVLDEALAGDLLAAFGFLGDVRARHHARRLASGSPPDDYVDPRELSPLERRHLKDAFEIIRSAQQTLTLPYPLQFLS